MKTTPATARPPPKAVLWKACGSPGALHIARLENGNSEILIESRMKKHVKTSTTAQPFLVWFRAGPGGGQWPCK